MSVKTPECLADEAYSMISELIITQRQLSLATNELQGMRTWVRDYEQYDNKRHADQRRMNEVIVRCLGPMSINVPPFSGSMIHLLLSRGNRHVNVAVGVEKAKLSVEHLIGYLRYIARDRLLADTMETVQPAARSIVRDLAVYAQDIHEKLTELGLQEEN